MLRTLGFALIGGFGLAAAPQTEPPACVPPAAYVPGVDAHGRPVVPADVTPPVTVQVSPNVLVEVAGRENPIVNETLVGIRLNGLEAAMNALPCPPSPRPSLDR